MTEISSFLAEIRKEKGFSQQKMADWFQIPQRTWANYETGRSDPNLGFLIKLHERGYDIPGLTDGSAKEVLDKISNETGLTHNEIYHQRIEQLKDLPPETTVENFPPADYKQELKQNAPAVPSQAFDIFRLRYGTAVTLAATETDFDALVLLPVFTQTAAAGRGQPETQLQEIDKYIPIVLEMLGGANPRNCGIVRVVGDSMTDMSLFNGDFVIFDRTQIEGDGVYVISIGSDVRVKHLEYRPIERKIVISSENAKRYPNPEIISYEQAENLLRIHGKVISWIHKHPY
ncbi:LexA family transcriptional regulator [Treponema sp.]|uniref:XRE family transcriptional regulator n=1 Tax=Treponema sp. TaxID=166 RepID=UPI0025E71E86|nr:LexA family transcriptional regulator [Treponema sp.]MBR4320859.1 hypothetical protein [Treponema sp.]MBR4373984.1 hypothetical protein [Treponema sp.]